LTLVAVVFCTTTNVSAYEPSKTYKDYAAYINENITLGGTSIITGNAFTAKGNVDITLTKNDGSNKITGSLAASNTAVINTFNPSQIGSVIRKDGLVFDIQKIELSSAPDISHYIDNFTCDWYPAVIISEDTHFGTLSIKGDTTIDVESSDRIIVSDKLNLSGGEIKLKGSHNLYLFANSSSNVSNSVQINVTDAKPSSNVNIFIDGNFNVNAYLQMYGNLYLKNGTINFDTSGSIIHGNILYNGSDLILKNNTFIYGVVYAPYSSVSMYGSSKIEGNLVANSLYADGHSDVIYAPTTFSVPDIGVTSHTDSNFTNGLLGQYYDSQITENDSAKRMTRIDKNVGFNWMLSSPDTVIETDTFSVKWTGYIEVPADGMYSFSTYSDDGIILKINNQNLINRWGLINLDYTIAAPIRLSAGVKYEFEMQYQEIPLNSTIFLFWKTSDGIQSLIPQSAFYVNKDIYNTYKTPVYSNLIKGTGNGLNADYYVGAQVVTSSNPIISTNINLLDFEWGTSSPDDSKLGDDFSAKFTGYIEAKYTGIMNLDFAIDDGAKVWVNDVLVLDKWIPNNFLLYTVPVSMTVGNFYKIVVQYNDIGGGAAIQMYWHNETQERQLIPTKYLYRSHP